MSFFLWSTAWAFDESPQGLIRDSPGNGENILLAIAILFFLCAVSIGIIWLFTSRQD